MILTVWMSALGPCDVYFIIALTCSLYHLHQFFTLTLLRIFFFTQEAYNQTVEIFIAIQLIAFLRGEAKCNNTLIF